MTDYRKRLEAVLEDCRTCRGETVVKVVLEDLRSLLSEAERLRDRDEEVREELADAWPEDREAVLAGDPVSLIAKLIRERDEEIAEHEAERSKSKRLRSLVEEAGKVAGDIATDADAFESDHTPTAGFVAGIAFSARSLSTKLKGEGQ